MPMRMVGVGYWVLDVRCWGRLPIPNTQYPTLPLDQCRLFERELAHLHPHAHLTEALVRLDEGAPNVATLDEPLPEGDSGGFREADGGREAGIRHRDHQVRVDRVLGRQLVAHPSPHLVQRPAVEVAV